ncbi:uncharacterized protein LOC130636452 [Hydractinia symbiolongicarpus]|uniref:uncharacterized protein LOC130636452 n=1 Tax=Hydractinia symbiolongicarpus TaxID=13093 RepID=UPI00254E3560|nr:uncharacterized protein LOC130636452 [Hydractinia symbiolongicarpus]
MAGILTSLCFLLLLCYTLKALILRLPECNKFDAAWTEFYYDEILKGSKHSLVSDHTMEQCLKKCMLYPKCKSVSIKENEKLCMLHHSRHGDEGVALEIAEGWTHIETDDTVQNFGPYCNANKPCEHGICVDTCDGEQYECHFENKYTSNSTNFTEVTSSTGSSSTSRRRSSRRRRRRWWK